MVSHLTNSNYKSDTVSAVQGKTDKSAASSAISDLTNHIGFTGFNTAPATLELTEQS